MSNKLDIWLAAFAVLLLVGASSSYRERALLPFDTDTDTGLLGRELQELGSTEDILSDRSGIAQFLPRMVRDALGTSGTRRRNIPALASEQPITSPTAANAAVDQGLITDPASGEQLALSGPPTGGFAADTNGNGGGGQAPGLGGIPGPLLGGGTGSPGGAVSLLEDGDPEISSPPQTPVIPPLVNSPVPEPSVWMMFLLGLFFTGAVLRRRVVPNGLIQSV